MTDANEVLRTKYIEVVEENGLERLSFDRYFEYLKTVQQQFSADLYDYASKLENYSIDGKSSLHDAWLSAATFAYRQKELTLEFLGPWHDRALIFKYSGIKNYRMDLFVHFTSGDGDVWSQEFRMDDGFVTHEIAFVGNRSIVVTARSVTAEIRILTSHTTPSPS